MDNTLIVGGGYLPGSNVSAGTGTGHLALSASSSQRARVERVTNGFIVTLNFKTYIAQSFVEIISLFSSFFDPLDIPNADLYPENQQTEGSMDSAS